ncbi:MAG: uracil-DNA glycosylase [Candidatus Neomarinimicrobiota bacterium]|nr:uracil-DNA glycosylase [Candidatus Neomarinimicrobiota bacterium]
MGETASINELVERYFRQTSELFGGQLYLDTFRPVAALDSSGTLEDFRAEICDCLKCPLGSTRTKFVFGVGNPDADLVLIGEAPGRDEDLQGEPFVGRAGQLLDKILAAVNRTRNDVYICNILKCRPPENRAPHQDEIDLCIPYLERQLRMISPKLIVALGATAAHALLNVKTPLGQLRSKIWKWQDVNLVATYHPAALLRNASYKRPAWEDFQWIDKLMAEA